MFRRASPAVIFKPFRLGRIAIVNEQGWTREPVFFSSLLRQNPSRMRLNVYCSVSYSKYLAYWGKFTVYFTNLPVILVSKLLLRRQNFYYHSLGRIRHERDSSGEASWLHCYHCFFSIYRYDLAHMVGCFHVTAGEQCLAKYCLRYYVFAVRFSLWFPCNQILLHG